MERTTGLAAVGTNVKPEPAWASSRLSLFSTQKQILGINTVYAFLSAVK